MKKGIIIAIVMMLIISCASCGSTEDEEVTPVQEYQETELSQEELSEDDVEPEDESETNEESETEDTYHFTGDREEKRDDWCNHLWSRSISYNEMLDLYKHYYEEFVQLDESLDEDAFLEADEQICASIAAESNITYDEFQLIFGILDIEDMNGIKTMINYKYDQY